MITRSKRRSRNRMDIITTIIHQIASFMIGPEYDSWDHTLQTTYITHLNLQHESTYVPYHIHHNSTRPWLGWIQHRVSNILRDTNMIALAMPFARPYIQSFRSHFSALSSRYQHYSRNNAIDLHHRDDGDYNFPLQSPNIQSDDTFTIRFYTINCHTNSVTHSVPAIIRRQDVTFQTARHSVSGANPIAMHDERGQPWASGYHPDGTPHPDSPHQLSNQPPLTPTPPTPCVPTDVYSFPISLQTLKQIRRTRVQHILEEYMWAPHYPPTSYGLEISDHQNLGHMFTAIVNERHISGPQPQHNTNISPYTRIIFRTARARRGYTQPLVSTTDAAADIYITFPSHHPTQHTHMWSGLRDAAKFITYSPQFDHNRKVEVLIQLRHDGRDVET